MIEQGWYDKEVPFTPFHYDTSQQYWDGEKWGERSITSVQGDYYWDGNEWFVNSEKLTEVWAKRKPYRKIFITALVCSLIVFYVGFSLFGPQAQYEDPAGGFAVIVGIFGLWIITGIVYAALALIIILDKRKKKKDNVYILAEQEGLAGVDNLILFSFLPMVICFLFTVVAMNKL